MTNCSMVKESPPALPGLTQVDSREKGPILLVHGSRNRIQQSRRALNRRSRMCKFESKLTIHIHVLTVITEILVTTSTRRRILDQPPLPQPLLPLLKIPQEPTIQPGHKLDQASIWEPMVRLVEYLTVLISRQTRERISPVQASRTRSV
jgi:hypothetical protein